MARIIFLLDLMLFWLFRAQSITPSHPWGTLSPEGVFCHIFSSFSNKVQQNSRHTRRWILHYSWKSSHAAASSFISRKDIRARTKVGGAGVHGKPREGNHYQSYWARTRDSIPPQDACQRSREKCDPALN